MECTHIQVGASELQMVIAVGLAMIIGFFLGAIMVYRGMTNERK